MDNKVTFTVAKALREAGLHVVRFNFRGFGGSDGVHDDGIGEQDDVRAAIDAAASFVEDGAPLLVAGFSFGSWVGTTVGLADDRVTALMAIAPPVMKYDYAPLAATDKDLAVIYARDDELVPVADVERWLASCARPPRITPVVGATHLFHGKLKPIFAATTSFVAALAEAD
jgi:alpha/beta superfamily hydrolase